MVLIAWQCSLFFLLDSPDLRWSILVLSRSSVRRQIDSSAIHSPFPQQPISAVSCVATQQYLLILQLLSKLIAYKTCKKIQMMAWRLKFHPSQLITTTILLVTRKHLVFGHIANSNQARFCKSSSYTTYDLLKHNRQKLHLAVVKTQFLPRKKTTGAQFGEQHLTLGLISHFTQHRDLSPKINPTQSTRGEMVVAAATKTIKIVAKMLSTKRKMVQETIFTKTN